MSKNNLIIVAKDARVKDNIKYYVFHDVNADNEWNSKFIKEQMENTSKYTRNRGKALIMAHNIQRKIDTEYGVREMIID